MALNVVEVAYSCGPDQMFFVALRVPEGTSAGDVLQLSGLFQAFPDLLDVTVDLGVFATRIQLDYLVEPEDRIVVYRPLRISPMEARQQRAKKR